MTSLTLEEALKHYGHKIIDTAYECAATGHIWLFNKKKQSGFARITEPEWGYISEDEIKETIETSHPLFRPTKIFTSSLPCTLRELVLEREPQVQSYFTPNR
jgi:hypothetical protein